MDVASQITGIWIFGKQNVQPNNQETSKLLFTLPLCGESTGEWSILSQSDSDAESGPCCDAHMDIWEILDVYNFVLTKQSFHVHVYCVCGHG